MMKRKIADYIEKLLTSGESLTEPQVKVIAYWELIDYRSEDYNEMSTLV